MINLTQQERDRFVAWCRQEAASNAGIVEQMVKVGMPADVVKKYNAEALACTVVAQLLESIEEETLRS